MSLFFIFLLSFKIFFPQSIRLLNLIKGCLLSFFLSSLPNPNIFLSQQHIVFGIFDTYVTEVGFNNGSGDKDWRAKAVGVSYQVESVPY